MDAAAPAPSSALPSRLSVDETLRAAARFGLIIELLCRAVAARGAKGGFAWLFRGVSTGPLVVLLWTRLRRAAARFAALAEQTQGPRNQPPRAAPIRKPRLAPPPPPPNLPRRFAWLLAPVPEAASGAAQLRHLLADPAMQALVAADPRFGRILRPLCRMIGIRPPPRPAQPGTNDQAGETGSPANPPAIPASRAFGGRFTPQRTARSPVV